MRIGEHIPSGGTNGDDHVDGDGRGDDEGAQAWKRRKRKTKNSRQK
jgi:hypothetical protein